MELVVLRRTKDKERDYEERFKWDSSEIYI